jgi:hypothetical protein
MRSKGVRHSQGYNADDRAWFHPMPIGSLQYAQLRSFWGRYVLRRLVLVRIWRKPPASAEESYKLREPSSTICGTHQATTYLHRPTQHGRRPKISGKSLLSATFKNHACERRVRAEAVFPLDLGAALLRHDSRSSTWSTRGRGISRPVLLRQNQPDGASLSITSRPSYVRSGVYVGPTGSISTAL